VNSSTWDEFVVLRLILGSTCMSNFSDKEDRMLIQLVHQHNVAKAKRISWSDIATQMKTKKTREQLRLRVVCLKKRFGNILANFPRWYFESEKLHKNIRRVRSVATVRSVVAVRNVATEKSDDSVAVDQRTQDKQSHRNGPLLDLFSSDDDSDTSLSLSLLSNNSKKSFPTVLTRKKLRRRTKELPLRSIETSRAISIACTGQPGGRADCNILASFNARIDVGVPVTYGKEIAISKELQQSPHGIESHATITAQSVEQAAAVPQLVQQVSQILFRKREIYRFECCSGFSSIWR
jgi:hypothetical protein